MHVEGTQSPKAENSELEKFEPIPLEVPCLATELGLKSIKVATGTEVGIDAVNLMLTAKHLTCAIFEETMTTLKECLEETEEEDEELDSDDVDDTAWENFQNKFMQ